MPTTINADGSVTYSVTIPALLTVSRDAAGGTYTAGGSTAAMPIPGVTAWRQHLAELIAISDAMEHDEREAADEAATALAAALYSSDVADVPDATPFGELTDDDTRSYRRRARRLAQLGVELKAGSTND